MSHKLRITIHLDVDLLQARMDVHGCLTEENCPALMPIIRRCFRVLLEPRVVIDTSKALHIDREGLDALLHLGVGRADHHAFDPPGSCSLVVPDVLPVCPARIPALQQPPVRHLTRSRRPSDTVPRGTFLQGTVPRGT